MCFDEYQKEQRRTMKDLEGIDEIDHAIYGIVGEVGEVVDLIKKFKWHGHPVDKEKLKEELGDVLWYLSEMAYIFDISLSEVASFNIEKLKERYPEGFDPRKSINRVK